MGENKPRVALLGAREDEIELLSELHRNSRVELTAVYDPDPHAPGLAVAEIAGVPAGADLESRQRLDQAEFVVLPADRTAFHEAIDWCGGLRGELIGLEEARRRWGGVRASGASRLPAPAPIEEMDDAGTRLASRTQLAEWLLDIAMRAVGASGGSLQLLSPQTDELYLLAARGLSEDVVRSARHPIGEPISGLTAGMSTPQLLHGEQQSRLHGQRGALISALSVPLRTTEGTVVGVLNVSTTVRGKRFDAHDLAQLEALGPHAARLLSRAHQFESATHGGGDAQLFDTLRRLEEHGVELGTAVRTLCNELRGRLDADSIALYLTTEDGNWLQIALDASENAKGAPVRRSAAARAYAERKWLHLVEYPSGDVVSRKAGSREPDDLIDAAVEHALTALPDEPPSLSCVYAPLTGTTPVGVLAATFSSLADADAFVQQGEATLRNIALYLETRLRERRAQRRLEDCSRLSRVLPNLLEARARGELEETVVREAAQLVAAQRAILRHVDEERRTYSAPITHGVPEAVLDIWRKLDAKVTERTLERRSIETTTSLREEDDDLNQGIEQRSLLSVPIVHEGELVAVLNVYDKLGRDPLEGRSFSEFDCDLLDDLARGTAPLLATAAAKPPLESSADTPADGAQHADGVTTDETVVRQRPAPPQTDSVRLRAELEREIARAERHQRDLGVSLMHIKGLQELSEDSRSDLLVEVMRLVRLYTRGSDLVGWYGPDRLMIVSPEAEPGGRELELRLRRLLRESVGPDARSAELEVRMGSSSYPDDGDDPTALLRAAASRMS